MEKIKDGGPAFPSPTELYDHGTEQAVRGMTLRDWFAGQALAAMTVAPDYSKGPCDAFIVKRAFVIADMMIAARGATHAQ